MFEITLNAKLKLIFPWLLVVLLGLIYMWHFNNLDNDFQVFYKAGLDFRDGINPWRNQIDPNALYLNGSSTLILFSILSFFPLEWAILLVRILSLVTIVSAIFCVRDLLHKIPQPQLIIFIFLSFPVRSAMEYGQLTVIFSVIAFQIIVCVNNQSSDTVLVVLGLALILDFKPHIFIGVLTFLILMRRLALLAKAFLVWLFFQIIVGFSCQIFPFIEMLKAISFRSETITEGEDGLSIISLFNFDSQWSTIFTITSAMMFSIYSLTIKRDLASKLLPLIALSLLITPLLHPTDLMLVLLVFILKAKLTYLGSLVLGMFFVWSPQLSGAGFTFFVILMSLFASIFFGYRFSLKQIALLFLPNVIYLVLIKAGAHEVLIRQSIHLMIPILIGAYYSLYSSKIDSDTEKSG